MLVRPAVTDEIDAMVALSRRVQEKLTASGSLQQFGPIPRASVADYVARGCALVLVEAAAGELLGGVFIEPEFAPVSSQIARVFNELDLPAVHSPRWWLQKLMIAPERQGGGLGNVLLAGVRRHVEAHGGGTVLLDCWAGNEKLRAFYCADGFSLHGEFHAEGYDVAAFTWTVANPSS
jgi:GNAT superfamily N-acetyltransferase